VAKQKPAIFGSITKEQIERITKRRKLSASELRKLGLSTKSGRYIDIGVKVKKGVKTYSRTETEKIALNEVTYDTTFSKEQKAIINRATASKGRTFGVRQNEQIERFILMHPELTDKLAKTKKGKVSTRAVQNLPEYKNLRSDLKKAIRAYERAGGTPGAHKSAGRKINEILFELTGEKRYHDILVQRYNA
jgi:hypothetical protein